MCSQTRVRLLLPAILLSTAILVLGGNTSADDLSQQPGFVRAEFVYEQAPFPRRHASTIAAAGEALVAAWFGGTHEKHDDVGIWLSRWTESTAWTEPVEVADGVWTDGRRYPCWNPVLFQVDAGPLLLFYKVGPSPSEWWGVVKTSRDDGASWSDARALPEGQLGPIKNKPVMLDGGRLLCGSSSEHDGWRVHMEVASQRGRVWSKSPPLEDGAFIAAIQPTILTHSADKLQILCRTRQGRIAEAWSEDAGRTWGAMSLTALPNPNSGIDAVTLADGRHLLVYNHTRRGRSPLNVALSEDGRDWQAALVLEHEPGEYSYPAVIQSPDGLVHITYTWKRERVRHVVVDPAELKLGGVSLSFSR